MDCDLRRNVVAKLIGARNELEDVLTMSPGARYDPPLLPETMRDELSAMRSELQRIIKRLEEIQGNLV